jgi:hypothetical protein
MLVPLSGEVNVKVIESLPFDFVRMLVAFSVVPAQSEQL